MLAFADKHKVSKIYLYVMPGRNIHEDEINPALFEDDRIEFVSPDKRGVKLNSNLKLYDTGILASQINPLTGFNKKLHRDFSYILPSPKIRYVSVPNTSVLPRFLTTTGALTHGNYKMHTAQGRKADLEHEYGFAFVEVLNNRRFNFHPIMAMKNGNFNHNREFYQNGKKLDQQPEALILGDWHTGTDTCPKTRKASIKMIKELKPKRVVFHDLFNGHSINRHEKDNHISKAKMWENKMHVLQEEVEQCLAELSYFANLFPDVEFLVVESNHDIFLAHYIGMENFLEDGQNSVFSCKLFAQLFTVKQQPILQTAMELVGKLPGNVRFLLEDEEYRVKGIGLSVHGHRGASGARGTSASFSNNNLRLITGHTHSPCMLANGMTVGTSTRLKLSYTKGQSSWLNAHGILFSSGKYSLITLIF